MAHKNMPPKITAPNKCVGTSVEYPLIIAENVNAYHKGDSQKIFQVIKHILNIAVEFTEKWGLRQQKEVLSAWLINE